jgi:hypothetical protein
MLFQLKIKPHTQYLIQQELHVCVVCSQRLIFHDIFLFHSSHLYVIEQKDLFLALLILPK